MKFMMLLLVNVCMISTLSGQLLNNPDSIVWDHVNNQWLVSNYGTGEIIAIDSENVQSVFSDWLCSTRGLKIKDDKLYAASSYDLAIFDLAGAYLENLIYIPEAVQLNDLDFDSEGNLYVSDYLANNVYKVNVEELTYELLIDYDLYVPNGLIFDESNNRIIAAAQDQSSSVIFGIDVTTAESEIISNLNIFALDGFAMDSVGNIYVSSWETDAVYRYNGNNICTDPLIVVSDVDDPADIYIRQSDNLLAIPLFNENTIVFVPLEITSENENTIEKTEISQISCYPNPFKLNSGNSRGMSLSFNNTTKETENTQIEIYNLKGQKVKTILLSNENERNNVALWNAKTDSGENAVSGMYFSVLKSNNTILASGKLILMK